MGLTSWAAFKRDGSRTMVMGDMVMTEDQVNPAMSTALDNGLEVTALHNHFFWDSTFPRQARKAVQVVILAAGAVGLVVKAIASR